MGNQDNQMTIRGDASEIIDHAATILRQVYGELRPESERLAEELGMTLESVAATYVIQGLIGVYGRESLIPPGPQVPADPGAAGVQPPGQDDLHPPRPGE
jgi:hypothetical protein